MVEFIVAAIVITALIAYGASRADAKAAEMHELDALRDQIEKGMQIQLADIAPPDPLEHVPEDARPLVRGLLEAARSVHGVDGFSEYLAPSAAEELRDAIEAVGAYAAGTSPETSAALLQTRLYDVAPETPEAFEARVFLGTPFTQESGRTISLIRQDLILRFRLLAATECQQCGAPLSSSGPFCEYCGARSGESTWRVVGVQPASGRTSVMTRGRASYVGYRTPDLVSPVRAME